MARFTSCQILPQGTESGPACAKAVTARTGRAGHNGAGKIRDGNVGSELGLMSGRRMSVLESSIGRGELEECVKVGFLSSSILEAMSCFRNKCLVLSP